MGKKVHDDVLDAALDTTALANAIHINTAEPADRAAAISDSLGSVVLTPGDGNGDFTIANGDTSGRKVTIAEQSGTATASGSATHISLIDSTRLLLVTTCTTQSISSGNPFTIGTFKQEIADPT